MTENVMNYNSDISSIKLCQICDLSEKVDEDLVTIDVKLENDTVWLNLMQLT